jgi:hypothetical protein
MDRNFETTIKQIAREQGFELSEHAMDRARVFNISARDMEEVILHGEMIEFIQLSRDAQTACSLAGAGVDRFMWSVLL